MAEQKGLNPIVASLAGAAVGAAVAAGTIVLSDKKNRKKLERVFDELKDEGMKVLDKLQEEAKGIKKLTEPKKSKFVKVKVKVRK